MPKAFLLLDRKLWHDDLIVQLVPWKVPAETIDRPHAIKYRLYCGRSGQCVVRYDNESGKGDHRHYGLAEKPYVFTTPQQLIEDFLDDVWRLTGWRVE